MIAIVFAVVGLNIFNAVALKLIASQTHLDWRILLFGIGFVIMLNGLRMLVWWFANKRFPLSTIYPLTNIFYPLMLIVSFYLKERITVFQIAGTAFITAGVLWLAWKIKENEYA